MWPPHVIPFLLLSSFAPATAAPLARTPVRRRAPPARPLPTPLLAATALLLLARHRAPPAVVPALLAATRSSCSPVPSSGRELRLFSPQEAAAAAAVPKHPEAAAVLHGSAHRGELGRSLQHLGLPAAAVP